MSEINPGDIVRLKTDPPFSNAAGAPTDPTTVRLLWRRKGAPPVILVYGADAALIRDSVGTYHADIAPTRAGTHYFRWAGTGAVAAAEESSFEVVTKFG